jgi:Ca2+-transporting ATPase
MGYPEEYARTVVFASVGFDSLIYIFSLRSLSTPIWRVNPFSNKYLLVTVAVSAALMSAAIFSPPLQGILSTVAIYDFKIWSVIMLNGILGVAMIEAVKFWFNGRKK